MDPKKRYKKHKRKAPKLVYATKLLSREEFMYELRAGNKVRLEALREMRVENEKYDPLFPELQYRDGEESV